MSKGEETRAAVLGHGLALASELGLEGVSIGMLAERAGMSKSGLFAHFKSKEALQLAILDEALGRFVAHVVVPSLQEKRGEPRVRALCARWLDWVGSGVMPGGCMMVQSMAELDDRPGIVRDRLVAAWRDWIDTLATAVRIAQEEGHFRGGVAAGEVAHEIASLAIGHHLLTRLGIGEPGNARVARTIEKMLDGIAVAAAPRAAPAPAGRRPRAGSKR